jgi:colicin import membrane protein
LAKEKKSLQKNIESLEKKKRKGKLTDIEIEKENIKISKQQIKIKELEADVEDAQKKLGKVRN